MELSFWYQLRDPIVAIILVVYQRFLLLMTAKKHTKIVNIVPDLVTLLAHNNQMLKNGRIMFESEWQEIARPM